MTAPETPNLLGPLFTTDRMREIFSDSERLQRMLDFEAGLAAALARAGIAPAASVPVVTSQCDAAKFDFTALARETALAGNVAIPMVKALTSLVAAIDEKAAAFVHWGATSQDAIDTGLVLQLRDALDELDRGLADLSGILAQLAESHISTPIVGRTWLQQGPPGTFGLKAAGWLSAVERHRGRLQESRKQILVIQFGGAVGTLAALGDRGLVVGAALADELKLAPPDLPWHAHRDRVAEVATTLGLLVGTLGKMARDISLMAQTEVDEVSEPDAAGRGGSSTMPHKRNPVGSAVVLAGAIRVPALISVMLTAMVQEHERGLGGWHAEWETLPEICLLAAGALAHITEVAAGLEIHASKMAENLEATRGLILSEAVAFALAKHMGKSAAHHLLEQASRQALEGHRSLRDVLMENKQVRAHLSADDLTRLLDPANYLGSAVQMTNNVLSTHNKRRQ